MGPLAGIPGSVGGAVYMNAGAHGVSMGQLVEEVEVADARGVQRLHRREITFGYRRSGLGGGVVSSVALRLRPAPPQEVAHRVARVMEGRRRSQPLGARSAGCVFKNPPAAAAGRLIEEAGLKGMRIGGAVVSEKHANFMVNTGSATPEELFRLMELVRDEVARRWGVELEPEVTVWS